MNRFALLLGVIAAVLAAAGHWFIGGRHGASHPAIHTPDNSSYYMTHATVEQLSPQGTLAYRMKVARVLHFADDSSRLTDIHVHYVANTPTYWNVQAARGRIPAGRHELYAYDGVVIHHPRPNGAQVTINTDHAWVRPRINRIDSDAHVVAHEPGQKVTGDGLRINLATNKLNLLDNVHVSYAP